MMQDNSQSQAAHAQADDGCCGGHGMRGRRMHGGLDKEQDSKAHAADGSTAQAKEKETGSHAREAESAGEAKATEAQGPLDILKERLARGEIDIPDFEARKRLIVAE